MPVQSGGNIDRVATHGAEDREVSILSATRSETGSGKQGASGAPGRMQGLDALRVLGCFAVVLGHVMSGWRLEPADWEEIVWVYNVRMFGLRLFSLITGFLMADVAMRDAGRTLGSYARHRASRLLIPTYFWVVVFMVLFDVLRPWSKGMPLTLDWYRLLFPAGHLWFPSFAAVAGVMGFAVLRHFPFARLGSRATPAVWMAATLMFFMLPRWIDGLPGPMANRSVAYLCFGVVMRLTYVSVARVRQRPWAASIAGLVLLASMVGQASRHHPWQVFGMVASMAFLGLGNLAGKVGRLVRPFAEMAFTIYLIHPLVIAAIQFGCMRLGYKPRGWDTVWLSGPVFIVSWSVGVWARRLGVPGWVLPKG
ncbi:MAG: acyltransferase [Verrucomicrobiales bacterium]|nr:acyltransferase [Verrucomicrobiales bacterium]